MLVQKNYDDEEDTFVIQFKIIHEGVDLTITHGFSDKDQRNSAFIELVTEETAKAQYDLLLSLIS
jgi:phage protein D